MESPFAILDIPVRLVMEDNNVAVYLASRSPYLLDQFAAM